MVPHQWSPTSSSVRLLKPSGWHSDVGSEEHWPPHIWSPLWIGDDVYLQYERCLYKWGIHSQSITHWLTYLPLVPHICVSESGQHWFRQWLVTYSAPSHYLNQCWVVVNWTLRKNLQWFFFIKIRNFSFTKMHLKVSSAKWWPFCLGEDELTYLHTMSIAWLLIFLQDKNP